MQSNVITAISTFLAGLTVIAQIGILVAIAQYLGILNRFGLRGKLNSVWRNGRILAFSVALTATLGSLFYSEVAGFEPCKLCWYQRVLMYPQVILLGIAIIRNDPAVNKYIYALCGIGTVIAGYHYFLQRTKIEILPCSAVGYSASCSNVFTMQFGYITIPLMALTAFIAIALFLKLYSRK